MGIMELIFGTASLGSLIFALIIYFNGKAHIHALIEKLRASRNNFVQISKHARRIVNIAENKEKEAKEKVMMMRQIARSIEETTGIRMNVIDEGKDWENLNDKQIYKALFS
jgi:hypothetical protein